MNQGKDFGITIINETTTTTITTITTIAITTVGVIIKTAQQTIDLSILE